MRQVKIRNWEFSGPAWRWHLCQRCHTLKKQGIQYTDIFPAEDIFESYLDWYAAYTENTIPDIAKVKAWPEYYNATTLWVSDEPGSLKWVTEAMILAEESNEDVASFLGQSERPGNICAYKTLFFDVDQNKTAPGWMGKYVWEKAASRQGRTFLYDYIFKAVAIFGKKEMLQALIEPCISDSRFTDWLTRFVLSERNKLVLTAGLSDAKLSPEILIPAADRVMEKWADAANAVKQNGSITDKDSMKKLQEALTSSMKITGMEIQYGKQEHVDADKYGAADLT